jgi:magnesium chelatase subunit I
MLVFTANPEDYTARGKIITPLKDRIGAEILTHYPLTPRRGWRSRGRRRGPERDGRSGARCPTSSPRSSSEIAFLARDDKRIDRRSGVSQRMPISVLETVVSNAERRALVNGEEQIVPRVADVYAALPAITGKIELEYEGELQGAARRRARPDGRGRARGLRRALGRRRARRAMIDYFDRGGVLQVSDTAGSPRLLAGAGRGRRARRRARGERAAWPRATRNGMWRPPS